MLPRRVQAERLDDLPASDPGARHSRRDLRRLHRVMRTRARLVRWLRQVVPPPGRTLRVLELGAGDGSLLLEVARELGSAWPEVDLTLLDRLALVDRETVDAYADCRWTARSCVMDVMAWADDVVAPATDAPLHWDVIVTSLFLHHFDGPALARLLAAIATGTDRLIACEPRRSWGALAGSHMVGLLGANDVTRTDAPLSVHAGFRQHELSALWPGGAQWRLQEQPSGAFTHCFRATRRRPQ